MGSDNAQVLFGETDSADAGRFSSAGIPSPTVEQQAIIEGALTGKDIKVQAFAGTGKTTTIKQLARVINKPSLYIAFNKVIVTEVGNELPEHVKGKTAHGLAYKAIVAGNLQMEAKFQGRSELWYHSNVSRFIGGEIDKKLLAVVIRIVKTFTRSIDNQLTATHISPVDRLMIQKMTASKADKIIAKLVEWAQENRQKSLTEISANIKESYALERFDHTPIVGECLSLAECQELIQKTISNAAKYSATEDISEEDFPSTLMRKISNKATQQTPGVLTAEALSQKLLSSASNLWNNIVDQDSNCAINFDAYLKMWQLSQPKLQAEVIYVDEAQDLDPVMLDVLKNQKAQMIWLGDAYQQIYAWRGAINALDNLDNCLKYELTETFRFSASIASFANMALNMLGESRQIKSNKVQDTNKLGKEAIIARKNGTLFDMALLLAQQSRHFAWADTSFKPDSLISHCQELIKIDAGRTAFMDMYKEFTSIDEIEAFLEEENNDTIAKPLALCKRFNFNITQIKAAVQLISSFVDPNANIVLTTAHKSKGQEWDKVTLTDDFIDAIEREERSASGTMHEWNLLYVALTRAKKDLSLRDNIKSLLGVLPTLETASISLEKY